MKIEECLKLLKEGKTLTINALYDDDDPQKYLYMAGDKFVVVNTLGHYSEADSLLPFHWWISYMLSEYSWDISDYHPLAKQKAVDYYLNHWEGYAKKFVAKNILSFAQTAPHEIRLQYDFYFEPPCLKVSVVDVIKVVSYDSHYHIWGALVDFIGSAWDFDLLDGED